MSETKNFQEIEPKALQEKLKGAVKPFLLDVREEHEFKICHIAGSTLIPLMTLFNRVDDVPKDKDVVVICRTGNRSGKACDYLLEQGFDRDKLFNLKGGTHAWADDVDSSFPKY